MMMFAEWQRARGIRPWTEVHGWSEAGWLLREFAARMTRAFRPIVEAFQALAAALAAAARPLLDALGALA